MKQNTGMQLDFDREPAMGLEYVTSMHMLAL